MFRLKTQKAPARSVQPIANNQLTKVNDGPEIIHSNFLSVKSMDLKV